MKLFLIVSFLCISNVIFGQKAITGTITNKDNTPLLGVRIVAIDTDVETLSDSSGRYKIVVPDGFEVLVFSKNSFKSQIVTITTETINLRMSSSKYIDMSLEELM